MSISTSVILKDKVRGTVGDSCQLRCCGSEGLPESLKISLLLRTADKIKEMRRWSNASGYLPIFLVRKRPG